MTKKIKNHLWTCFFPALMTEWRYASDLAASHLNGTWRMCTQISRFHKLRCIPLERCSRATDASTQWVVRRTILLKFTNATEKGAIRYVISEKKYSWWANIRVAIAIQILRFNRNFGWKCLHFKSMVLWWIWRRAINSSKVQWTSFFLGNKICMTDWQKIKASSTATKNNF